jgi:hypothetical protein
MPSTNTITAGIMIVPDNDDFLELMMQLQEEYNKQHGQTGSDEDED